MVTVTVAPADLETIKVVAVEVASTPLKVAFEEESSVEAERSEVDTSMLGEVEVI